jgi:RNA polymerase sigma factor (sigma-70 family)
LVLVLPEQKAPAVLATRTGAWINYIINILTENVLGNTNFCEEHRGDERRQEVVFDKGDIAFGLSKGSRTNPKTVNDLSQRRWRNPILDSRTERDLIRGAKSGDEAAKQKLVEAFHRLILKIVSQYSGPPHTDLMAAALLGFCEAINRFNENRGCRLSTYAEPWVRKCILLAIENWRREGAAGETRQDRYIFSNPRVTAEQVVAAVGGTLANAEKAIARLAQGHVSYDTTEASFDAEGNYTGPKVATSHEICLMYDRFSRFQMSPQLRLFEPTSRWIDELANHHTEEDRRHLKEIGRRQYVVELGEREKARGSYRSKPGRYLYRTNTSLKERTRIAARMDAPVFARPLALVSKLPARGTVQQYELDAPAIQAKNARLKALRLERPPKESKPRRKRTWHDTRTTTPKKSCASPCPPTLQARPEPFVKKNFSASATFAELHCSAI